MMDPRDNLSCLHFEILLLQLTTYYFKVEKYFTSLPKNVNHFKATR
jgi:hypothetical protein